MLANNNTLVLNGVTRSKQDVMGGLKMFMVGIKDQAAPRYGIIIIIIRPCCVSRLHTYPCDLRLRPGSSSSYIIITFPDHPIWRITDTDEMYGFLGSTFPQMDWRAAVPRQHMDTFASHPGGTFPQPQACSSLGWAVPHWPLRWWWRCSAAAQQPVCFSSVTPSTAFPQTWLRG